MPKSTCDGTAGYSLIELLFAVGLTASLTAVSIPEILAGIDRSRAYGATRYIAAQLNLARTAAAARAVHVGIRFEAVGTTYQFAMYVDGNGDGIRTVDIQQGIDRRLTSPARLATEFGGADFGVLPNLPPVDSSSSAPGTDPIKFGASSIASFSPLGAGSSGSVYVLGPDGSQYVVRVLGETGRVRILKFDSAAGKWNPL